MPSELHLPLDNWLKFLSTQAGRDKVYRFIQYFSRFLSYHLKTRTDATDVAMRLSKLSLAMGMGRKCKKSFLLAIVFKLTVFRMGKPLDFLQTMLKSLGSQDEVIRWGLVAKSAGYGGWLILDMIQWVILFYIERDPLNFVSSKAMESLH